MEKEGVQIQEKALRYISKVADGSMRDALSLLDQCIAFHLGSELTYDNVLDVLGAVDTEVFSRLLRSVLNRHGGHGQDCPLYPDFLGAVRTDPLFRSEAHSGGGGSD